MGAHRRVRYRKPLHGPVAAQQQSLCNDLASFLATSVEKANRHPRKRASRSMYGRGRITDTVQGSIKQMQCTDYARSWFLGREADVLRYHLPRCHCPGRALAAGRWARLKYLISGASLFCPLCLCLFLHATIPKRKIAKWNLFGNQSRHRRTRSLQCRLIADRLSLSACKASQSPRYPG